MFLCIVRLGDAVIRNCSRLEGASYAFINGRVIGKLYNHISIGVYMDTY